MWELERNVKGEYSPETLRTEFQHFRADELDGILSGAVGAP